MQDSEACPIASLPKANTAGLLMLQEIPDPVWAIWGFENGQTLSGRFLCFMSIEL